MVRMICLNWRTSILPIGAPTGETRTISVVEAVTLFAEEGYVGMALAERATAPLAAVVGLSVHPSMSCMLAAISPWSQSRTMRWM